MGERADAVNVIDVMGLYVPILVVKQYLAIMGFVKYLINRSGSSYRIVNHGIQTLVNMSNYHAPIWHFDATFVPGPQAQQQVRGGSRPSSKPCSRFKPESRGVPQGSSRRRVGLGRGVPQGSKVGPEC